MLDVNDVFGRVKKANGLKRQIDFVKQSAISPEAKARLVAPLEAQIRELLEGTTQQAVEDGLAKKGK